MHPLPRRAGQQLRHLDGMGNQYWPAEYLIDARGRVRYTHFGEGDYDKDEQAIRTLLAERGSGRLPASLAARRVHALHPPRLATPETYVGTERAQGWVNGPQGGTHDYGPAPTVSASTNSRSVASGRRRRRPAPRWAAPRSISTSRRSACTWCSGRTPGRPRTRAGAARRQADTGGRGGRRRARRRRHGRPPAPLHVVNLKSLGGGYLSLRVQNGVSAYSFTFG